MSAGVKAEVDTRYRPLQPGIPKSQRESVRYKEYVPHSSVASVVYRFWYLYSKGKLDKDFMYVVLPDGCVDLIFDLKETPDFEGALVMTPATTAEKLNLGKMFSYVGIRFWPGAWNNKPADLVGSSQQISVVDGRDLSALRRLLAASSMRRRLELLNDLANNLINIDAVRANYLTEMLLSRSAASVEDYALTTNYSRRQLQRIMKNQAGYSPHDFIKIVRFQEALRKKAFDSYADQSHFIKECKRITSFTPQQLYNLYW